MNNADQPGEKAWRAIEAAYDSVDIYSSYEVFVKDFKPLFTPVGHLLAVHWCNSEICNGGFCQFFENSTGVLAPEALAGYRAIGATPCAELLEQAMEFLGNPYPRSKSARQELLPDIDDEPNLNPFEKLDDQYFDAKDGDGLYMIMDRYAIKNEL